jgi:hypothetical protein
VDTVQVIEEVLQLLRTTGADDSVIHVMEQAEGLQGIFSSLTLSCNVQVCIIQGSKHIRKHLLERTRHVFRAMNCCNS